MYYDNLTLSELKEEYEKMKSNLIESQTEQKFHVSLAINAEYQT